jgi:uncharacterized protein YoxC
MEWAAAVTAVSTAVIALVVTVGAVVLVRWIGELYRLGRTVRRQLERLEHEARPALESARAVARDTERLVASVRQEIEGFAGASKDVRDRLNRAADAVEERLHDIESVVDMVQYEVEETALDVAAALRTTRRSASVLRAMKRAFLGRRR